MEKPGLSDISPAIVFRRPALDSVWLGPAQRRVIAFATETRRRAHSAMILGARACGKSVVLDQILAAVEPSPFFRVSDGWESGRSLLTALLETAGLGGADLGEVDQRNLLQTHLDGLARAGAAVVFAVDDADRLSGNVWRELLRIGSMSVGGSRPFMLFVGRTEAEHTLQRTDPSAWGNLQGRVHLMASPTSIDCGAYIEHRLRTAGMDAALFPMSARLLVGRFARGSFVRVNLLAQTAMLLARQRGCLKVSEEHVYEACQMMADAASERGIRPGAARARTPGRDRLATIGDARNRQRILPAAESH